MTDDVSILKVSMDRLVSISIQWANMTTWNVNRCLNPEHLAVTLNAVTGKKTEHFCLGAQTAKI